MAKEKMQYSVENTEGVESNSELEMNHSGAELTPEEKARKKREENLVKFTSETAAEMGARGGVASGETRRRQRTFRESVNAILRCQVQDPEQRKALEALGIDPTMLNQIQLAVYGKAAKGDVEAARFLRDTRGEKPREGVDMSFEEKPLASLDLSKLSDDDLRRLADQRSGE